MWERRYPTHEEVRGLLEKLDDICREAERICSEVESGLHRRRDDSSASPQLQSPGGEGGRHFRR